MNYKSLIVALSFFLVVGCDNANKDSWCSEHSRVHIEHQDTVTKAKIYYTDLGELNIQISIPIKDVTYDELNNVANVVTIESNHQCLFRSTKVLEVKNKWQGRYNVDCGVDNKLKNVSISLLENFSAINEIEALIQTPASSKNFILSRQCSRPIFNL